MKMPKFMVLGVVCLVMASVPANAATVFTANLTGAGENPPNGSPATGSGTFTLSDDQSTLAVDLSFSSLTAPASAAHIHCCAAPGANAPVVLNFVGVGFPTGVTSGTFMHTFTLSTDLAGITTTAFLNGLFVGTAYANIHDANFPGGEIRGQLLAQSPEPGTLCLLGLALAGLGAARVRRMIHR